MYNPVVFEDDDVFFKQIEFSRAIEVMFYSLEETICYNDNAIFPHMNRFLNLCQQVIATQTFPAAERNFLEQIVSDLISSHNDRKICCDLLPQINCFLMYLRKPKWQNITGSFHNGAVVLNRRLSSFGNEEVFKFRKANERRYYNHTKSYYATITPTLTKRDRFNSLLESLNTQNQSEFIDTINVLSDFLQENDITETHLFQEKDSNFYSLIHPWDDYKTLEDLYSSLYFQRVEVVSAFNRWLQVV